MKDTITWMPNSPNLTEQMQVALALELNHKTKLPISLSNFLMRIEDKVMKAAMNATQTEREQAAEIMGLPELAWEEPRTAASFLASSELMQNLTSMVEVDEAQIVNRSLAPTSLSQITTAILSARMF